MTPHHANLLARLDEHHSRALAVVRRGDVLLGPRALPDPLLLSRLRWELTRILSAYQAFAQHELLDPIIRSGSTDKARLARQIRDESLALAKDFRDHVARCTNLDVAAHWNSIRAALLALLARIEAHMRRERWVCATMLFTQGADQPAPAAAVGA